MPNAVDDTFAQFALQAGLVTCDQLDAAQLEQSANASKGKPLPLADVLIRMGVITPVNASNLEKKILAAQQGGMGAVSPNFSHV